MNDPQNDMESVLGSIPTTILTPSMSSENIAEDAKTLANSAGHLESSVPQAGSSFILRHAVTDKVLTFQEGDIRLGDVGGHYTFRWKCVENKGWFGFRDPASHMFLGHDDHGIIRCQVKHHKGFEEFCLRHVPGGGYNLLVKHGNELRPIGLKKDKKNTLAKIDNWSEAIVWQFIKV
jgi:predicted RNA binding protein YcfA (HicA-like mRNA interferase family)